MYLIARQVDDGLLRLTVYGGDLANCGTQLYIIEGLLYGGMLH